MLHEVIDAQGIFPMTTHVWKASTLFWVTGTALQVLSQTELAILVKKQWCSPGHITINNREFVAWTLNCVLLDSGLIIVIIIMGIYLCDLGGSLCSSLC